VLDVTPAVQLHDARLACVYMVTFCMAATFFMGAFAAFYGSFSGWFSSGGSDGTSEKGCSRVYTVEIVSALLSICMGILWLTLLSLGKLHDVFP
jgi:hypothetical protein